MAFINETENRKFVGRKLILDWGKARLEITKLPYGGSKDPVFTAFNSPVLLANVYKTSDGHLEDEIIGTPEGHNGNVQGYDVNNYVEGDEFWRALGEQIGNVYGVVHHSWTVFCLIVVGVGCFSMWRFA